MAKRPSTAPKPFCFVLMPFAADFNDVYKLGIKPACTKAGTYPERVDEQIHEERILDRIYNQIAKADIVVADMSRKNPNVFYEVGYAHALGKLTIMIIDNVDDIPFDMKHFSFIVYSRNNLDGLKAQLAKRVRHYVVNPPAPGKVVVMPEVRVNGVDVSGPNAQCFTSFGTMKTDFILSICNTSGTVVSAEDVKIGLVVPFPFKSTSDRESVRLGEARHRYIFALDSRLLPGEWSDSTFQGWHRSEVKMADYFPIQVTVYSLHGSQEYSIGMHATKV